MALSKMDLFLSAIYILLTYRLLRPAVGAEEAEGDLVLGQ